MNDVSEKVTVVECLTGEQTIAGLFLRQAKKTPLYPAVADDQEMLTYEQLARRAGSVAQKINEKTGRGTARVCILAAQNISAIAGMLGVLMSGKCFVPMLPQENDNYLRYLWENSEASLIVCSPQDATRAGSLCGDSERVITCGAVSGKADIFNLSLNDNNPEGISAIMYTSGSTGKPKGVMTTQWAILNRALQHIEMAGITSSDRQASVVPWQFAASYPDVFAPLLTGASIYIYDNQRQGIERLGLWIKEMSITLLALPSALLRFFIESISPDVLSSVRYAYVSGGAVKVQDAGLLLNKLSENAVLMHGFGSTETNLLVKKEWRKTDAIFQASCGDNALPAGYPVASKKIQIVDEERNPVALEQEGELAVISRDIFPGYWKQPEMTAQCLKELPSGDYVYYTGDLGRVHDNGCLEIIGRKGHRVKIRGLRIDLAAVEAMLRSLSYVRDAAAVSFSASGRENQLTAYLETSEELVTATMLREDLKKIAPDYMIPSRFVMMEPLPRTASGKIDRNALPPPGRERPVIDNPYVSPRNELERHLAEIWADVLDIEAVGINDNFFELGGDSLSALRLLFEIERRFGCAVSAAEFFQHSTVESLTIIIYGKRGNAAALEIEKQSLQFSGLKLHHEIKLQFPVLFREAFKGIKVRIRQKVKAIITAWLYEQTWIKNYLTFRRGRLIRQFYNLIETPLQSEKDVIKCEMICHVPRSIRKQLNKQLFLYWLKQWTPKVDMETLEKAYQRGNGVIIVRWHSHAWINSLVNELVLERVKPSCYGYIGRIRKLLPAAAELLPVEEQQRLTAMLFLKQLMEGRDILRRAGIVWILPDGRGGLSRGITFPFHGRMRSFKTGFAELAIETGAEVIPVSLAVDFCKKQIIISSLAPFDVGPAEIPHAECVEGLVKQYVAYLKQEWARCPGLVPYGRMKKHLGLPIA